MFVFMVSLAVPFILNILREKSLGPIAIIFFKKNAIELRTSHLVVKVLYGANSYAHFETFKKMRDVLCFRFENISAI